MLRHATENQRDIARDIRRAEHAHEIGEPRAFHRHLETARLRYHPRRHVAAVAPARHRELVAVGDATRDHRVGARHDVAIVATAPVRNVATHPFLAVACRSPGIWIEHGPPLAGPELARRAPARLEAGVVGARRSAVDIHEHRIPLSGAIADGLEENALDLLPVGALPRHDFTLA